VRVFAAAFFVLALVVLPTLGLQGCASKNAASAGPEADAQADAALDPCAQCNQAATSPGGQCASEADTCNASATCTALATCIGGCASGDMGCINTCAGASPAAVSTYDAVGNCLCGTSCAAVCGASCVGAYDAGPGDAGGGADAEGTGDAGAGGDVGGGCSACESAATTSGGACYAEVMACNANAACGALLSCLGACQPGDTSCATNCQTTDQAGTGDLDAVNECLCMTACATPCSAACGG
jgi:hypothetical protein